MRFCIIIPANSKFLYTKNFPCMQLMPLLNIAFGALQCTISIYLYISALTIILFFNVNFSFSDCRPCSDSELIQLFCSSDFAAKGFITGVRDEPELQRTVVTLLATKVFQQTNPVFAVENTYLNNENNIIEKWKDKYHMTKKDWSLLSLSNNNNIDLLNNSNNNQVQQFRGKLYLPLQCKAKTGHGEYLFLGTLRLGEPVLRCAPKLQHWIKLVQSARDLAHCTLET